MLTPETLIAFVLSLLMVLWFVINALFSVSGVWEKEKEPERPQDRERLTLGQFGPFVVGRAEFNGGYQSYSGLALGPKVWLRRRDYGIPGLIRQGFPKEIAADVEGQVMAKLRLHLSSDRIYLVGYFLPYKVSFKQSPPQVLSMVALEPKKRRYRRVEYVHAEFGQKVPLPSNK